ncbi:succinate-semialdehyde dehydrogenase [Populus alba x Populus x berolinensis]|nr:succinate-semialdehyde dehydrogenase [Populus alba x Populus x berolinensis]
MGKAPDIGDASCASPEVRKITFTRSTAVGKKLMAVAAGTVKRLAAKFRNSGQTCVCANRIIGQEGIFDKFGDAFSKAVQSMQVGDGF